MQGMQDSKRDYHFCWCANPTSKSDSYPLLAGHVLADWSIVLVWQGIARVPGPWMPQKLLIVNLFVKDIGRLSRSVRQIVVHLMYFV